MATGPKPSLLKRLLKFLILLILLLVLLVALAPMLFSGFIRDSIVAQANKRLDGSLEVADFSFGWTSGIDMGGVRLVRAGRDEPALEVDEVRASPDILAALSGRFLVEDVALDGVTLRVRRDEKGIDWKSVMKPSTGDEKKGGDDAGLPEFRLAGLVSDLRVVYDDVALGAPIEFRGMTLDFRASRDDLFSAKLAGPEGLAAELEAAFFADKKLLATDAMRVTGKVSLPKADLARFAGGFAELVKIDRGIVDVAQDFNWAAGALDLKGRVLVDDLAARQNGRSIRLATGEVQNDLAYGSAGLGGNFDLQLARIAVDGLPRQVATLDIVELVCKLVMPSAEVIRVEAGRVQLPSGRVDLSGELRSGGSSGIALKGDVDLAPLVALFEGLPGLEGKLKLNGNVTRDGDSMRLRGQHLVEGLSARDLAPGAPEIRNETMTLGHDLTLAGETYDLNRIDLDSSFAKLKLEGLRYRGSDRKIVNFGKKESPLVGSLDLDRLAALLGGMMPMELKGRADLAARVASTAGTESAEIDLVIDSLVMGGGPLGDKTLRPGRTRIGFSLGDIDRGADSPMKMAASSSLFDLRAETALAADPVAAFGRSGRVTLTGWAALDQLLAPFFAADHLGKTDIALDTTLTTAGFDLKTLRLKDKALTIDAGGSLVRSGGREKVDLSLKQGHYVAASGARIDFGKALVALQRGLQDDSLDLALDLTGLVTKSAALDARPIDAGNVRLRAKGTLDAVNKAADLELTELRAAGCDLKGSVDWSQGGGLEKLRLDGRLDWSELSTRFLALVDPAARGKGVGPVTVDLTSSDGSLQRTSGRIDLTIPSLFVKGCDLSTLELKAAMSEGKGTIERGQAKLNGGTIELGGAIDMTGDEPQFGSNFRAKNVNLVEEWQPAIARIIPIFAGVGVRFSGLIDTDVDLRGKGATWDAISKVLNGQGNLSLRQGRVESAPAIDAIGLALGFNPDLAINDLLTAFQIKDGGVHQDGLEIKTGVIDLRLAGTTYLDGRLDYKLGLKPVSQEPARWQQFVSLLTTDGYLPLGLGGTVKSPSPKLPNPADIIRRGAEDAIKRGLGDILKPKEGDGEKPKNPLGGLIDVLDPTKKPAQEDKPTEDKPAEQKPKSGIGGLIDLLGGKKEPKKDG